MVAMTLGKQMMVKRTDWAASSILTLNGFADLPYDDVDALGGAFAALVHGVGSVVAAQVVKREAIALPKGEVVSQLKQTIRKTLWRPPYNRGESSIRVHNDNIESRANCDTAIP